MRPIAATPCDRPRPNLWRKKGSLSLPGDGVTRTDRLASTTKAGHKGRLSGSSPAEPRGYIVLASASASPIMPAAVTSAPAPGPETTVGYWSYRRVRKETMFSGP